MNKQGGSKPTPFDGLRSDQKKKKETIFTTGGEAIHKLVQAEYAVSGQLGSAEAVLVDKGNLLVSKVDMTLKDGTPVEVKSTGAEEIRQMTIPHFEHVAQLSYYIKSQGLQKGYLMYVARENTGLRKVFSIDVNGLYRHVAEQSVEYMQVRRGGVSPDKFQFALEEGVKSYRSNEYYVDNFRKITEEAKQFQGQIREMQRKKDWLQTYRTLTSGLYEKNALAVSGMQKNFAQDSEWGSPFRKKKLLSLEEQEYQAKTKFLRRYIKDLKETGDEAWKGVNPNKLLFEEVDSSFRTNDSLHKSTILIKDVDSIQTRAKANTSLPIDSADILNPKGVNLLIDKKSQFVSFDTNQPSKTESLQEKTFSVFEKGEGDTLEPRKYRTKSFSESAKLEKEIPTPESKAEQVVNKAKTHDDFKTAHEQFEDRRRIWKETEVQLKKEDQEKLHEKFKKDQELINERKANERLKQAEEQHEKFVKDRRAKGEEIAKIPREKSDLQIEHEASLKIEQEKRLEVLREQATKQNIEQAKKDLPSLPKRTPGQPPFVPTSKEGELLRITQDRIGIPQTINELQDAVANSRGDVEFQKERLRQLVEGKPVSLEATIEEQGRALFSGKEGLASPLVSSEQELSVVKDARKKKKIRYKTLEEQKKNKPLLDWVNKYVELGPDETPEVVVEQTLTQKKKRAAARKSLINQALEGKDLSANELEDALFERTSLGRKRAPEQITKTKENFVKDILARRDEMVQSGEDKVWLEREARRREKPVLREPRPPREKKTRVRTFPERKLDPALTAPKPLVPASPPSEFSKIDKALTFFDIETSYGKNATSTPFVFEFAGTHLEKETVSEISTLQGLEATYRHDKAKITKNSLHLQASILNEEALGRVREATSLDELIEQKVLGKESLGFYSDKVKQQRDLGRDVDILQLVKEDVKDIGQTTGSYRGDTFHYSEKYKDFEKVGTLEEMIQSQKKMIGQVDEFFGRPAVQQGALAGHNIVSFDINKLVEHADNLRGEIKHLRDIHQLEKVDTLTSELPSRFFKRVKELSREMPADVSAAFFEKQEVVGGGRKKSLLALEHLSRAMGFGSEASHTAGAHRASYDVHQQNMPVFSWMQDFLGKDEASQKQMAEELLTNYSKINKPDATLTKIDLPDITKDINTTHLSVPKVEIPKSSTFKEVMTDLSEEAAPWLKKVEKGIKTFETALDKAFHPSGEQLHTTFMRRPGLGILGLGVGAAIVGGVALSSMFGTNHSTKPIRPTTKPLVHEDARVFPENESDTRIEARAMTDFGSGYQGLRKVLQAPGLKHPPVKDLGGLTKKAPGAGQHLAEDTVQVSKTPRQSNPGPATQIESSATVELLPGYEKAYILNKSEMMSRTKRWQILNSQGTRSVFEGNANRTGHHRMSGV